MINKIRTALVGIAAVLTLTLVPLVMVGHAAAVNNLSIGNCVSQGTNGDGSLTGDCAGYDPTDTGTANGTNLTDVIKLVVNVISIIVGVVAVIMIIWGGMKYITSGGESGKITSAKNTIIYALIGLVIVALAQFIVKFVLAKSATIGQ